MSLLTAKLLLSWDIFAAPSSADKLAAEQVKKVVPRSQQHITDFFKNNHLVTTGAMRGNSAKLSECFVTIFMAAIFLSEFGWYCLVLESVPGGVGRLKSLQRTNAERLVSRVVGFDLLFPSHFQSKQITKHAIVNVLFSCAAGLSPIC